MSEKFYITTPIYYVNDKPHIGHAYTTVAADILARYNRLLGKDVCFLTGTDEHGAKIMQAAQKKGMDTKEFCDEKSALFQKAWQGIDITNDDFIRTTDNRHQEQAEIFLQKLYDKGLIYKGVYKGLYCVGCESYKTEQDLVDGLCPDHKKTPVELEEENYFFKLSEFNDQLKQLIESDKLVVSPSSRKNEVLGLLNQGLTDIAISRANVPWGIPLPFDPKQTTYVWIEALMNYVTAPGIFADKENFNKWWPADLHIMAKDIIKFHALIWPAMLLGIGVLPPKQVYAHGFFTIDGQKMSKTIGNVIDPLDMVEQYGSDAVRYFLLSEFSFGSDGDISLARFAERYQSDLANSLGNLVSRVLSMADKEDQIKFDFSDSKVFKDETEKLWQNYHKDIPKLKFNEVLNNVRAFMKICDQYVEQNKPWELAKTDPATLQRVLGNLLEAIRHLGWLIRPFMPNTSDSILSALGQNLEQNYESVQSWGLFEGAIRVEKIKPLFPRIEINGKKS